MLRWRTPALLGLVLLLPALPVWLACGSGEPGAATDDTTSGGDVGAMQMRDRSAGPEPSDELGSLRPSGSAGSPVSTERAERERTPDIDTTDPGTRRDARLPLTPSEADRNRIFRGRRPDIQRCLRGTHATFTVRLRVAGSGVVRQALVQGEHIEGTERAHCIEAAFRDTMFPEFRDPETTMSTRYRF